jgi:hypothetical protein
MLGGVAGYKYKARDKEKEDDTIEDSFGHPSSPSILCEKLN